MYRKIMDYLKEWKHSEHRKISYSVGISGLF